MNRSLSVDPRDFADLATWLRAALEQRGESPERASVGAGLSRNTVRQLISTGRAQRPTLDALAAYFDVNAAELRALRTPAPRRVAAGKRVAERLGQEHMRAISLAGREKARQMTAEQRSAVGKIAGAASWRRKTPEQREAMLTAGWAARKATTAARGSFFVSDETRAAAIPKYRAAGRRGGQATLERYGTEHMSRAGTIAAAPKRNGELVTCVYAGNPSICATPDVQIYRTPSMLARGRGVYHRSCYEQWRRSLPQREKSHALGTVGWIWSVAKFLDDEKLKTTLRGLVEAQISYLRNPRRRGRPATLIWSGKEGTTSYMDMAIAAAIMHDEYDMTAREIGEIAGKPASKIPGTDWATPARVVWDWIRMGRPSSARRTRTSDFSAVRVLPAGGQLFFCRYRLHKPGHHTG